MFQFLSDFNKQEDFKCLKKNLGIKLKRKIMRVPTSNFLLTEEHNIVHKWGEEYNKIKFLLIRSHSILKFATHYRHNSRK